MPLLLQEIAKSYPGSRRKESGPYYSLEGLSWLHHENSMEMADSIEKCHLSLDLDLFCVMFITFWIHIYKLIILRFIMPHVIFFKTL